MSHNFAQAMTAKLSWHVQIYGSNRSLLFKWDWTATFQLHQSFFLSSYTVSGMCLVRSLTTNLIHAYDLITFSISFSLFTWGTLWLRCHVLTNCQLAEHVSVILNSIMSAERCLCITAYEDNNIHFKVFPFTKYMVLYYYSDLTLWQEFQPMAAQVSMKAAHPWAKILTCYIQHRNDRDSGIILCMCPANEGSYNEHHLSLADHMHRINPWDFNIEQRIHIKHPISDPHGWVMALLGIYWPCYEKWPC